MLYYRCKCGKSKAWGSMPPFPCSGCSTCGTTMEVHPDYHTTPKPHDFIKNEIETDEGFSTISKCKYCGWTLSEIKKLEDYTGQYSGFDADQSNKSVIN